MIRPEAVGAPSNWGRWGETTSVAPRTCSRRGSFERRPPGAAGTGVLARGAALPRWPNLPTRRPTWHVVTTRARGDDEMGANDDVLMMHTHGTTHIDALRHIYVDDTLYNGHPATGLQPMGAQRCGIDRSGRWSRGACCWTSPAIAEWRSGRRRGDRAGRVDGVRDGERRGIATGDIVLVRTGWWRLFGRGPQRASASTRPNPA